MLLCLPLLLGFAAVEAQAQTGTLSISAPADANEGDSSTRDLVFTVSLSAAVGNLTNYTVCFTGTATIHTPSSRVFSAPYPAIPGTADFQPTVDLNGVALAIWNQNCVDAVIDDRETSPYNIIGIRVKGDTDAESDETVIATLSLRGNALGVTLGTSVVTHTILDDDTPAPEVSVAPDWALIPSGISTGGKFRLLFVTSTQRDASATDIATYNTFVQNRAAAGHTAIRSHSAEFRVVASTSSVDARDNTSTKGTGVPIYWLGSSNSNKVADNYADFYDGNWDNYQNANENGMDTGNGSGAGNATVWTGSNNNGTRHSSNPLGATNVQYGQLFLASTNAPFNRASSGNSNSRHLYGLSPVFTVAAATAVPEVSVRLMTGESENRNPDGEVEKSEVDGTVSFPLSLDTAPTADMTVCVQVAESGDTDRVTSANEGIKTVSFLTGVQTGSIDVAWTDTAADDLDSVITVTAIPSNTMGCTSSDEYTVSSTNGSDKVRITDDEATTVSLASSDMEMGEGNASNTAVMTVSLGRALISGESVVARITLATSTDARLPGHATPDFGVTATGTGVALSNQTTATPTLTFTGSDSNTVQTATVTLTPVANLDDPDAIDETITATLSLVAGTGSGTVVTGGDVEVVQASSVVTLTIDDDEAVPAGTPGFTLSKASPLRLLETGTATYTVVLDAAPTADVRVSVVRIGAMPEATSTDHSELTFTTTNWNEPQTVTVTGQDESGTHRNRSMVITHGVSSDDSRYGSLSNISLLVNVDDAPEVEAFWDFKGRLRPHPSTLNLSGEGNPEATQNAAPFTIMSYAVRLSNRPEPDGTVSVTATVPADKRHLIGLSLNENGPWSNSLTVDFKDREPGAGTGCSNWHGLRKNEYFDSGGNIQTVTGGRNSETWDSSADTPWKCWRRIYVIRYSASRNIANTCVDITHTATGGGVRRVAIDTVRAHIINSGSSRKCGWLKGNTLPAPQNSPAPAQAAPAPTEKISNLQVTEVDATSVSVTWDAVEHATSYDVSWSAESSDSLNASAGALPGVTGTTTTIQHDALVPMTLTVTVTPEYIDENGVTKQLDALASEATLEVGPGVQRLDSGGGTNGGDGGSIDAGFGAVDLPVPVSHWRFEDDAVDWVGSSHGTEKGGVAFQANEDGEGVESYALSLDGTDDYIDLASHVSDFPLGDSTRSITGWFKADTGNQRQTFFTYGPNVEGKRFSIAADRTQVLVAVSGHAWGVNGLELKDGWHHVAVTYAGGDSDDISVYLDGELQSASNLAGSSKRLDTQTGPAAIGRSVSGTKYYTGLIDDVRLYDVALSAEHVLALFEEHPQAVLAEDNPEVCVSDELVADVEGYSEETWRESADHVERWERVLETFSGTASDSRVMTPTEAEGYVNRGWPRWEPVLEALECLEEGNQ